MNDWAEKERDRLSAECGCIHSSEPIALALRLAKAEAYAEAARICVAAEDDCTKFETAHRMMLLASQIMAGKAPEQSPVSFLRAVPNVR